MGIQTSLAAGETGKQGTGSRRRKWILRGAAAIVALLVVAFGLMWWWMGYVPAGLDYATERMTDEGLFRVSYVADSTPIPINQMHVWTLHVENAAGEPVEDAEIMIDGDMPQHGHGLPTQPMVTTYLGNGDYLVEGVKFQMGGWWVMDFTVRSGEQSDFVRFNMILE